MNLGSIFNIFKRSPLFFLVVLILLSFIVKGGFFPQTTKTVFHTELSQCQQEKFSWVNKGWECGECKFECPYGICQYKVSCYIDNSLLVLDQKDEDREVLGHALEDGYEYLWLCDSDKDCGEGEECVGVICTDKTNALQNPSGATNVEDVIDKWNEVQESSGHELSGSDRCVDGTLLRTCSSDKPFYCTHDGELVSDANTCGCPVGKVQSNYNKFMCADPIDNYLCVVDGGVTMVSSSAECSLLKMESKFFAMSIFGGVFFVGISSVFIIYLIKRRGRL